MREKGIWRRLGVQSGAMHAFFGRKFMVKNIDRCDEIMKAMPMVYV